MNESFTWHDGDGLESPENPEGSETGEVAEFDEGGEVACNQGMILLQCLNMEIKM